MPLLPVQALSSSVDGYYGSLVPLHDHLGVQLRLLSFSNAPLFRTFWYLTALIISFLVFQGFTCASISRRDVAWLFDFFDLGLHDSTLPTAALTSGSSSWMPNMSHSRISSARTLSRASFCTGTFSNTRANEPS